MSMPYYTLGRSGLRVSRLALGTMTFGTEWGWGSDKKQARRLFDMYAGAGGNFYDTADLYTGGTSEEWLGEFVKSASVRDSAVIATKYTFNAQAGNPNAGGNNRKNMLRAVEGSLKRLKTDYIDLYLMHAWDQLTEPDEVMRSFEDLVRAGKIRYFGFSDVPSWYASRAQTLAEMRGLEPVSTLQLEYSLTERNLEFEFTDLATRYGMGIMVWSPLASGLLSGKYKPNSLPDGRLRAMKDSTNPAFQKFSDRNWKIVSELEKASKKTGHSMAQIAINWIANRPGVASVLLGATKPEQLKDTLASLDFTLPKEVNNKLEEVSRPERKFPYIFFDGEIQGMVHGGTNVGDKFDGYFRPVRVSGAKG